jgi:plasmid stability protein
MESEIRAILEQAVAESDDTTNPFVTFMERFQEIGGVELDLPPRTTPARWADFS